MYYEEKEIDGVLMFRITPDGKWEPKPFPVWITKYALTSGITTATAIMANGRGMIQVLGQKYQPYYHGKDWWGTEGDALLDFERRKNAKLVSLTRILARIEKLQPKIRPLFPKEAE